MERFRLSSFVGLKYSSLRVSPVWRMSRLFQLFLVGKDYQGGLPYPLEAEMSRWSRRRRNLWPIDFEVNISGLVAGEPFSIHLTPEGVKAEGLRRLRRMMVPSSHEEREPLVEVIEMEREVKVVAELPGAEKDSIDLRATEERITIHAETPHGKYHKELELPSRVEPKAVKATYRNGILEVHLPKKEGGIGEKIPIE